MEISEDRFRSILVGTATNLSSKEILIRQAAFDAERREQDPLLAVEAQMSDVVIVRKGAYTETIPPLDVLLERTNAKKAVQAQVPDAAVVRKRADTKTIPPLDVLLENERLKKAIASGDAELRGQDPMSAVEAQMPDVTIVRKGAYTETIPPMDVLQETAGLNKAIASGSAPPSVSSGRGWDVQGWLAMWGVGISVLALIAPAVAVPLLGVAAFAMGCLILFGLGTAIISRFSKPFSREPSHAVEPSGAGSVAYAISAFRRGDYPTALRLLRPLAEQGNANALFSLGVMYERGKGVTKDDREAAKLFRRAAEQGLAIAQWRLGVANGNAEGVTKDDREAAKWLRLAAEQGYSPAQYSLGVTYMYGYGVTRDFGESLKWFRLAAEQGYAGAQYNLGLMYANGLGTTHDYVIAHMWLNLSAAQGHKEAQTRRDRIADEMAPAQIAEAQRLARDWRPSK